MQHAVGGKELLNIDDLLKRAGVGVGMTVADLGCGNAAFFSLHAARLVGSEGAVYAVDILKSVLTSVQRAARQQGVATIRCVWANLEIPGATKIPAASADVALLVNTLFQSNKRLEVLREAVRMLKPGGRLLIVDWKQTGVTFGPSAKQRVSPEELRVAAKQLGLRERNSFEAGMYHFGLLFEKR